MLGIKYEILKEVTLMFAGSFAAAACIGFSLLKSYEEFKKGVERKSRIRIWSAFFSGSFLVIFFMTVVMRLAK